MLFRDCAGGVVFMGDRVFLLQNEKEEWVLPKGVIRGDMLAQDVAVTRVLAEGGVHASILCAAGETCYEFFSITRRSPVCNRITWFIMRAESDQCAIATHQGFRDGGFFAIGDALAQITYTQDRSLVRLAYDKYCGFQA